MPTVTVLDDYQNVALESADWTPVRTHFELGVINEHVPDTDALVELLADSTVVVAMRERTPFPGAVLGRLPALQLLVTTGMRNAAIDLDAAASNGIMVCGTESSGNAVPEMTMGMIVALTRNFAAEDAAVRAGGWQHTIGPELGGKTLGVLGLGRLGIPVARLAQAFGMRVVAWSPHLTADRAAEHDVIAVDEDEFFAGSDVISVHVPLSERSRGLVGASELAAMQPTSYLINTSRGPIVDEAALIAALHERRIAGAGLDVYDIEPLPMDHPLRSTPNTLLLPHIGYVTTDAYRQMFTQAVEDTVAWHEGRPVRTLT